MRTLNMFLLAVLLLSCQHNSMSPETQDGALKSGTQLQIDLQQGFAGKYVRVELNDEVQFRAWFSNIVSLAGPEATFTSYTSEKKNRITVFWRCANPNDCGNVQDSEEINLGNLEKYYIGIAVSGDSIILVVQDTPFLYL